MGLNYKIMFNKLYFKRNDLKKIILAKIKENKLQLGLSDDEGLFSLKNKSIDIY